MTPSRWGAINVASLFSHLTRSGNSYYGKITEGCSFTYLGNNHGSAIHTHTNARYEVHIDDSNIDITIH